MDTRLRQVVVAVLCGMALAGCRHSSMEPDRGRAAFDALQAAVAEAKETVAPSIALVKLKGVQTAKSRISSLAGGTQRPQQGTGTKLTAGTVLTREGHVLIPGIVKPDAADRIEVWIGDTELTARVLRADDHLGMTILKTRPSQKLIPVDLVRSADLETGGWCVTVEPSDEDKEFETFAGLALCRGTIPGRYRTFVLDRLSRAAVGTPVVDIHGRVVGLLTTAGVLAMSDMQVDLQDFLDEATGVISPDEEAKKKGWIGMSMMPINKEYAASKGLPKSALWVTHVFSGAPAEEAGMQEGDLIVALNGKPLRLTGERVLSYFLKSLRPKIGNPFSVSVVRDGKETVCEGAFTKRPEPEELRADDLGITVRTITDAEYYGHNLFTGTGVMVTQVHKGSAAATGPSLGQTLLRTTDVITELDGHPTPDLDAFTRALDSLRNEKADAALVRYRRGRMTGFAGLNLKIGENANGGTQ